jgi:hypothetical protein
LDHGCSYYVLFCESFNATIGVKFAAYGLFQDVEVPYSWVASIIRLIRPVFTILLVVIVWYIFSTTDDLAQQETIIQCGIYMALTAVLFWFGDRAMRPKK